MHCLRALESLFITGLECGYDSEPDLSPFGSTLRLTIRAVIPSGVRQLEILHAIRDLADRRIRQPITAADLGLAERLAVARDTIATATPEQLAELAVCVDAAISRRGVAEYRSPADVARIAELEGL
jgi:hypothetical protein